MRRPPPRASGLKRLADIVFVLVLAGLSLYALNRWGAGDTDTSDYRAIDGDSLRGDHGEIRLHGIDAPELHQECRDDGGRTYPCGRRALDHLKSLIAGRVIACTTLDIDRYQRRVARCTAGGRDLGGAMVKDGWAIAYLGHALDYAGDEAQAHAARRGLWAGDFEAPEDWRRQNRRAPSSLAASEALPPD